MQKQSEHVAHATDRIRPKTSRIRGACGIRHPHVDEIHVHLDGLLGGGSHEK